MASNQPHITSAEDRVSWERLLAYGMGGLIPIALFNIAGQLMALLGNISLGLSAFWLGVVMILPRLWDAFSDPVVGHLSDNTRSRWGRRRPYILIGGIAVALSFVAMWWVPRGEWIRDLFLTEAAYNWFQLAYILLTLLVFFTACTVFEIPHGALGMEMSPDYHERTRLFSAKSFCGNLFAMGTPWLIFLATLKSFAGKGGDLVEGMRYLSIAIAVVLTPLSIWWFAILREPGFAAASTRKKTAFWDDMAKTLSNKTFLILVLIIFTLAMGFNFVANFSFYITIFYLYGGDVNAAGQLLGINGTVWAVTGLLAVFPLNWISRRIGKSRTLLLAILIMCGAQLSKIACYDPSAPYLVLIPTVLLSSGMLMFFTLGSSMVGDVCDDAEFRTGQRAEGSYYAVYWWFIKMGTALASFVAGALIVYTGFDERQNVLAEAVRSNVAVIQSDIEERTKTGGEDWTLQLAESIAEFDESLSELEQYLVDRQPTDRDAKANSQQLLDRLRDLRAAVDSLDQARSEGELTETLEEIAIDSVSLKTQTARTLFRLRAVEIGTPLALCLVSVLLTLKYPLTEARCYEIKETLKRRREEIAASTRDGNERSA